MDWKKMNAFNESLVEEFRANSGKVTGQFENMPVMLLTHTGAKSGKVYTSPLVYSTDGDDMVIIASKGGAATSPDWYHNLVANPDVTVEVGRDKYAARAEITEGDERQRLYDQQASQMEIFKDYAEKATPRVIPVVRLVRTS